MWQLVVRCLGQLQLHAGRARCTCIGVLVSLLVVCVATNDGGTMECALDINSCLDP